MKNELIPILCFLFGIAASLGFLAGGEVRSKKMFGLISVIVVFCQVLVTVICAYALETQNLFSAAFSLGGGRVGTLARILAFSTGFCTGVAASTILSRRNALSMSAFISSSIAFGALLAFVLQDRISMLLPSPEASVTSGLVAVDAAEGVQVQQFDLTLAPSALATGPDGSVFVAGYTGGYLQGGAVLRVDWKSGAPVSVEVARGLTRPHGLAYVNPDLYVSRAGQQAYAKEGVLTQESTGAVTQLRDLDNDGVFDYYHDIVVGLPGAQLPDGLHQNNGLAYSDEAGLLITVGTSTDHGPPVSKYEGTIQHYDFGSQILEEFATGVRNPYGITFGPFGLLFCTDNDPNFTELGDKLCVVERGDHLGFPYDSFGGLQVEGLKKPLARLSSAQGLSYIPADEDNRWADCLLLASYGDDAVSAIRIHKSGDELTSVTEFIARINDVVDVTYAGENIIFACSYIDRKLYRIQIDSHVR